MKKYTFARSKKIIKEKMIEKKGYLHCQNHLCLKNEVHSFHHIVYQSKGVGNENLHHPDNLILVCLKCHNKFHSNPGRTDILVKRRKLRNLFPDLLKKYKG